MIKRFSILKRLRNEKYVLFVPKLSKKIRREKINRMSPNEIILAELDRRGMSITDMADAIHVKSNSMWQYLYKNDMPCHRFFECCEVLGLEVTVRPKAEVSYAVDKRFEPVENVSRRGRGKARKKKTENQEPIE